MANLTNMDLDALKAFARSLEDFKQSVEAHCNTMDSGISGCQQFMKDASSQKALLDGQQICTDIRAALNPTQMLLEKIRSVIQYMENEPTM